MPLFLNFGQAVISLSTANDPAAHILHKRIIYHEHDRGLQPAAAEGHKVQERFPDRRQSAENAVSGDDGYYEKVDGSAAGLEPHPCAVVHLFR